MSTDPREFEHPIDECNHPTPSQLPTVLGVGSLTDPAVDAAADALQHWMLPGVSAHAVAIAALSAAAPIIAAQAKAEALAELTAECLLDVRAGLALAHESWGQGASTMLDACNKSKPGTPWQKPVSPYATALLQMIKAATLGGKNE